MNNWKIITHNYKQAPKEIVTGIGIELQPGYFEVLFNTVLPDDDKEYIKQHNDIKKAALLAAAAPDLLEALTRTIGAIEKGNLESNDLKMCIAAIDKANGK